MEKLVLFLERTMDLLHSTRSRLYHSYRSLSTLLTRLFHLFISNVSLFWFQLYYYILMSLIGFMGLRFSNPRTTRPQDLDLFFTSVSAATVSSISTVEMEAFSNTQLVVIATLMLVGGEVFTSMIGLQIKRLKLINNSGLQHELGFPNPIHSDSHQSTQPPTDQLELVIIDHSQPSYGQENKSSGAEELNIKSIRLLGFLVFLYVLVSILMGSILLFIYMITDPSASDVLRTKGIQLVTFCLFTAISTFANGGFAPTNENMMVFAKNPGFLLLLIPQLLIGNTLFGPCLYFLIWASNRIKKSEQFAYLLENNLTIGYTHLFSGRQCIYVVVTSLGFITTQFILFCALDWGSDATRGLNLWQKVVGSLFQVVNSRHAGESVFDLALISPAVLVLFMAMMYLPPYTAVIPVTDEADVPKKKKRRPAHTILSHICFLVVFIIIICIIERDQMKADPLNFSALNITFEVVSSYGNVGFTTGYKCERRLNTNGYCKDASYGFAGRWSNEGKIVLIIVMLFGRLKNFTKGRHIAWKLSRN